MNPQSVDIRSDLYSLGCTLYFLLTGQVPFPDPAPMEKILKHNLAEPTPLERPPGHRAAPADRRPDPANPEAVRIMRARLEK